MVDRFAYRHRSGLPDDWHLRRLRDVCVLLTDGTHFSPTSKDGPFLYITSKNIGFGSLDLSNVSRISEEEHNEIYKRCPVKQGDLLLTKDGANTGNAAINTLREPFSLLSSVALLRARQEITTNQYLLQYILSPRGQYQIKNEMAGQAITRLTLKTIGNLVFPFPRLPEQRAIAAILSTWDEAITLTEQLIAALQERKRGLMQRLLTGEVRFPEFDGQEWKKARLEDCCQILDNQRIPLNAQERAVRQGNIPYWGANGVLDYIDGYIFDEPLILIAEDGGYFEDAQNRPIAHLVDGKCWVNNHAHVLRAKPGTLREWVYYWFVHRNITPFINSGTRSKLNQKDLRQLPIMLPTYKEQEKIAGILQICDQEIQAYEHLCQVLKTQKTGLMQRLLTGEIRVKVDD